MKLGPGDDAKKLKALGHCRFPSARAKLPVALFRHGQCITGLVRGPELPSSTTRTGRHNATLTSVAYIRTFRPAGSSSPPRLRLIKLARQRADKVRQLLRKLGDAEEDRALNIERSPRRTKRRLEMSNARTKR